MQTIFNFKDEPKFCSGWSTWPSEARPAHISVAPPIGKASYGPGGGREGALEQQALIGGPCRRKTLIILNIL